MPNYLPMQAHTAGPFQMDLHPYVAAPEDRTEVGAALQYGADFRMSWAGKPQNRVGLIQLIFPQTQIFVTTIVGAWNVDKRDPALGGTIMEQCLYGDDTTLVGAHSEFYNGQHTRGISDTGCWLIDTPREINARFAGGVFSGVTNTKFANYVVELSDQKRVIYDQGVVWGYSVVQNDANPAHFDFILQQPKNLSLSATKEHLTAITAFLQRTAPNLTLETVKSFIA